MSLEVLLLLSTWTLCEVLGQILFKRGVDDLDAGEAHFGLKTFRAALRSPAIWGGVLIHGVEFGVWIEILGRLPLSVAGPPMVAFKSAFRDACCQDQRRRLAMREHIIG